MATPYPSLFPWNTWTVFLFCLPRVSPPKLLDPRLIEMPHATVLPAFLVDAAVVVSRASSCSPRSFLETIPEALSPTPLYPNTAVVATAAVSIVGTHLAL